MNALLEWAEAQANMYTEKLNTLPASISDTAKRFYTAKIQAFQEMAEKIKTLL